MLGGYVWYNMGLAHRCILYTYAICTLGKMYPLEPRDRTKPNEMLKC